MNSNKINSMSNSRIIIFVCKLWILTNFVASLIIQLYDARTENGKFNYEYFWGGLFVFLIFGLFSSLPAILIIGLIIKNFTMNKFLLVLTSIIFVFLSFRLADFDYIKYSTLLIYPIVYSIVITILILTLKLGQKNIA